MAQPIPAATSASIPISAAISSMPPQSPHAKDFPLTSLTSVQSDSSRSASPQIRSILKSTSSSPQSEPLSQSPKSVSSSKENSPRLVFSSYPEVDQLKTATEAELLKQLVRIYTVFEGAKEVLGKLKNQLLVLIDPPQEKIFAVLRSATNDNSTNLQTPYESLIQARALFLQMFNPWEEQATSQGQTEQELNEIRNRVLKGFRRLSDDKPVFSKEDPKLNTVLHSVECQEFILRLALFKRSLKPLCQKYGIDFIARLKTYRFLIRKNEYFDTVGDWISHHLLRDTQAYHQPALEQMTDEAISELNGQIVNQKDPDVLKKLVECSGKERSLITDYNRMVVSFYVRNTQIISPSTSSSPGEAIIKIQIRALWQLSQLTRFVHRLDRYLQNEKLVGKERVERIQSLLNYNVTKCFKIFARAIEFGKTCEQLYLWLSMLCDFSDWSGYRDMQDLVRKELIQYLDVQGFLSKKIEDFQQAQACARFSTSS